MEKLLSHIESYLRYLNEECDLSTSVHFSDGGLRRLPKAILERLLPYNCHENAYCMAVKARGGQPKCVASQKEILSGYGGEDGFCRECHASVREYIAPVREKGIMLAYVAVSGYRRASCSGEVADLSLWQSALCPTEPPLARWETLTAPLCVMLEKLFSLFYEREESEYNLMVQFLHEYHTDMSLETLCDHFGRSPSHVSHMFKKQSGMTVRSYCNALKLEDAKRLLRTTERSVTEIAFDVGFRDVSYFIRLFREKEGRSPLRYRKEKDVALP